LTLFHETCETLFKQHMKHYLATYETSHLPHSKAIHETSLCNMVMLLLKHTMQYLKHIIAILET